MRSKAVWIFAIVPAVVMVLIALVPQISLWQMRGEHWAGSYAASNYDEVAYSGYINGLINGKPRKYDPMMGVSHEHESIFSLQFIPAYSIAIPAKLLGLNTSSAFILLQALIAIFSALAIFVLLRSVTDDPMMSGAGALIILCLGTAVTFEGAFRDMWDGGLVIEYLPFLRRYQPGFAFPIFFLMCWAVWRAVTNNKRSFALAAGLMFATLVFSYFYLWTAAAAWLACFFAVAFILRSEDRRAIIGYGIPIAAVAVVTIVPYLLMLNMRSRNSDEVQLLTETHAPDVFAPTVIVGLLAIAAAAIMGFIGRIDARSWAAILGYAFCLTPLAVLNQQVVTGRSLQPVHYEIFIANYCVLAGVMIIAWLGVRGSRLPEMQPAGIGRWVIAGLAVFAAGWGIQEGIHASQRNAGMAIVRDGVFPVAEIIANEAAVSPELVTVQAPNPIAGSFIPTVAPVRVLWNPHLVAGGMIDESENKQQFYRHLYYSGFAGPDLENALRIKWFEVTAAIFGGGRALPQLGGVNHPITDDEIVEETAKYQAFIDTMDDAVAYSPKLTYVVVAAAEEPNFANIDKWYTRDTGRVAGLFKVYTLTPKSADHLPE